MKRIFVSLSIVLSIGLTTVFATNKPGANDRIKELFKKEYVGAELVKWETTDDYHVATFSFHNHLVIAYYGQDGTWLGSAREVVYNELPLAVIKTLDKRFAGTDLIQIHEINNNEGTSYWLTLETQGKSYHVKAGTAGNILQIDKTKRK